MNYHHVLISAENKEQALAILDVLLPEKLVFGGPILEGPAKFWWKGEIVSMDYAYILTYTRDDLRERMIAEAEAVSEEEVCMISCMPCEPSVAFKQLLDETFA